MLGRAILLGLCLVGADGPPAAAPETAADRVTLRDGSVVLGLVTSATTGQRGGSVEFLVRRAWAEKNVDQNVRRWDRSNGATTNLAISQRQKRLETWKRERASHAGPDDRIIQWIDREQTRLAAPGVPGRSILIRVRLARTEVRGIERRPAAVERLLRLGWLCELPEPESMPVNQLKDALEGRGFAVDGGGPAQPVVIDRLLPPTPEPEATWLARRAATELLIDSDLRFLRYNDVLLPDAGAGAAQPLSAVGLTTALSELKRLLDLDQDRTDPLVEKLKAIAARGRIGALVTRLEIQPDMSSVTVECTLWVRTTAERWVPFGSRSATVRPDDLRPEAGQDLAADPQVQGAFKVVEMLGLGAIPADLKARSLRIGASTEKALGMARDACNQDLEHLVLPVLEPASDDRDHKKPL
jgi:hypothetical protein